MSLATTPVIGIALGFMFAALVGAALSGVQPASIVLGQEYLPNRMERRRLTLGLRSRWADLRAGARTIGDHWGLTASILTAACVAVLSFFAALMLPDPEQRALIAARQTWCLDTAMATLVLGVGLVGSHVVRALLARGDVPVGFDHHPAPENLAGIAGRFDSSGRRLNLAALIDVMRSRDRSRDPYCCARRPAAEASPYEGFRVNVGGAVNALEAARLCGIKRFVFYSSMAVFAPDETAGPLDEGAPQRPAGMNGAAKICVENVGEIYASAHGTEFVALRIGGVYGAGRSSGGVPQQLHERALPLLRGESYVFEPYVYDGRTDVIEARDAATAGILAADLPHAPPRAIYNVGNGEAFTYESWPPPAGGNAVPR